MDWRFIPSWTCKRQLHSLQKKRILREYTRYRYKLISCRSSEKNRYQNALTVCNVALDSVVSDIFGKSSTSIIDYLLQQSDTSINHEEIASKLLRSLKSKEDSVIESIEGYQMTDSQKYRMCLVRAHMNYIIAEINDVDSMIENLISSDPDYENAIQFLSTIPGGAAHAEAHHDLRGRAGDHVGMERLSAALSGAGSQAVYDHSHSHSVPAGQLWLGGSGRGDGADHAFHHSGHHLLPHLPEAHHQGCGSGRCEGLILQL